MRLSTFLLAAVAASTALAAPAAANDPCADAFGVLLACWNDDGVRGGFGADTADVYACIPEMPCPHACLFGNFRVDFADPASSTVIVNPYLCQLVPIPALP